MRFRTEYEPEKRPEIGRASRWLLLGSCFSDEIGSRLERDGFACVHNPLGPLYNPLSTARTVADALADRIYTVADLADGPRGHHCLDYASRYSGTDPQTVAEVVNADLRKVKTFFAEPGERVLAITFGTVFTFYRRGVAVGNCHKFPAAEFERRPLTLAEIVGAWQPIIDRLPSDIRIVFTVSPIRHLADGLHGNALSKATLLLAVDALVAANRCRCDYFPAFEILNDDLRDYRFYAADMKHPSETAADYIYQKFCDTYFSAATLDYALASRRDAARSAHRQILP